MLTFKIENLSYEYRQTNKTVKVLDTINLSIKRGEFLAITGASGSGKSTLLYLLGGILKCQDGKLYTEGEDISKISDFQLACIRSYKIGFIYQQFFLLPKLTVLENILLPTQYPIENTVTTNTKNNVDNAINIAKKLGIENKLSHFPNELSGGEQQRVAIARALIRSNNIILADEPTGNLDPQNSQIIIDILKDLHQEGYTIVMVTHDLAIAKLADRQISLQNGEINQSLTYKNIISPNKTEYQSISTVAPVSKLSFLKVITKIVSITIKTILLDKVRLFSNILGIMIGIASMVAIITLAQFLKEKVVSSYSGLGTDVLTINGYPNFSQRARDDNKLVFDSFKIDSDLKPLKYIFPQIISISPLMKNHNLLPASYGGKHLSQENARVLGVKKDFFNIMTKKFILGNAFYNTTRKLNTCVIGYAIFNDLLSGSKRSIGKIINIGKDQETYTCRVVGVVSKDSNNHTNDYNIYLPYDYFISSHQMPWLKKIHSFILKGDEFTDMLSLSEAIKRYFVLKYKNTGRFFVDPNVAVIKHMNNFIKLSTVIFMAIAIFSLGAGGIGIVNMMLSSIQQRIEEIGLKKAVGATNLSIRMQFLLETFWFCLIGGILGIVLGIAFYEAIIFIANNLFQNIKFQFYYYPPAIWFAFISIITMGFLCGMIPAWKAEKLDIIFAIRGS